MFSCRRLDRERRVSCFRQTAQAEEDPHANHGVRHAESPHPDPVGHRRAGPEGLERVATVVLLVRHIHRVSHLPTGQEGRRVAAVLDHTRRRYLQRAARALRQEHPGTRSAIGLRRQPSQIGKTDFCIFGLSFSAPTA